MIARRVEVLIRFKLVIFDHHIYEIDSSLLLLLLSTAPTKLLYAKS